MKQRYAILACFLIVICSLSAAHAAREYTDQNLGYSIYLPDDWVVDVSDPAKHLFYDSTGTATGLLSITRFQRNSLDYPTPREWTQAFYIAYLMTVDYSIDPWGTVLYVDSSSTSTQNSLWAPEAYSRFYSLDTTLGTWDEYLRYSAADTYGYELAALSDTADMKVNVGLYAAILQGVTLPGEEAAVIHRLEHASIATSPSAPGSQGLVDPLGRHIALTPRSGAHPAAGIVIGPNRLKRPKLR